MKVKIMVPYRLVTHDFTAVFDDNKRYVDSIRYGDIVFVVREPVYEKYPENSHVVCGSGPNNRVGDYVKLWIIHSTREVIGWATFYNKNLDELGEILKEVTTNGDD